ncbi:MAG: PorT family protein [Chitinophagaceae bacterium]|nr:PorT family protein [Chitinophagaceae bacterium]
MKLVLKLTVIIVFVFFSSQTLEAQNWHYGVKADLNYAAAMGNGLKNKYTLGYGGGIWANYAITKKFKFQPELSLAQYNYTKGDDFDKYYKNDVGRVGADKKIKLAYVNLPLLLRYDIIRWVSVFAGPQIGIAVFEDENLRKDGKSGFKNTDVGVVGGVQANLGSVGVFGRFTQGLSNINNVSTKYKWNSQRAEFGIAIRIK